MRTTSILFLLLLFCGVYAQPKKLHFNAANLAAELQAKGLSAEEVEHRIGEQYRAFIAQHQTGSTNHKPVTLPLIMADSLCNADFEKGNLSGWQTATGKNWPGAFVQGSFYSNTGLWPSLMAQYPAMDSSRIIVTDKNFSDNCNVIPSVSPRGNYSILLGDTTPKVDVEELYYTFTVTPNNYRFAYWFACVEQTPGHTPRNDAYFSFKLYHQGDTFPMDPIPGSHQHLNSSSRNFLWKTADTANLNFNCKYHYYGKQTCLLSYIPWTKRVLDLSPYIGQTLTAVITNTDCAESGHFGYSYVDIECSNTDSIEKIFICKEQSSVTLQAQFEHCAIPTPVTGSIGNPKPYDYSVKGVSYMWTPGNDTSSSIVVSAPGTYTVETTAFVNPLLPNQGVYKYKRVYEVLFDTTNNGLNITNPGTLCTANTPVVLTATPSGGIFVGEGISGNSFSPSLAGVGTHVITYNYVSALTGCSYSDTMQVKVDVCMGVNNLQQSNGELSNLLLSLSDPSQMQLYVEKLNKYTNIKISDVSGKEVYIGKTINPDNLMQLYPGVYIVSCGSSKCNHKLVLVN